MKRHILTQLLSIIFFGIILTSTAWSGQVVTEEIRQWASRVIEQDKILKTDSGIKTVAILYFNNKTGQARLDPLQKGLTLMLINDLSFVEALRAVERVRLQAVIEEMGVGVAGLVGTDTAPRVGKILGARWLVTGDILKEDLNSIHIESSILDTYDQQVYSLPRAEGTWEAFVNIEKYLLFRIIESLKIELTLEERALLKKPLTKNINALLDFFKAIDESDRGNYRLAERYYERALKSDPDISYTGLYLGELRSLELVDSIHVNDRELMHSLRAGTSLTDRHSSGITTKREQRPEVDNTSINIGILLPSF